jgi:hypothetical protein
VADALPVAVALALDVALLLWEMVPERLVVALADLDSFDVGEATELPLLDAEMERLGDSE